MGECRPLIPPAEMGGILEGAGKKSKVKEEGNHKGFDIFPCVL